MGELEFEQKALVKAVDQALVEQTREEGELRLNTPGGRFQVRWDDLARLSRTHNLKCDHRERDRGRVLR